jgi:ligand-binding sensor domain-containing protein
MATKLRWKPACFALVLLVLVTNLGIGQQTDQPEPKSRPLTTTAHGLPLMRKTQGSGEHDNVHVMLQDKVGDLWFATTGEGVYRYDARTFTQYTQKDGLSSNTVYAMLEDRSGNIWFGTEKGISRYDGKSITGVPILGVYGGRLRSLLQTAENASAENEVWSIMQDRSGTIWFGTSEGLYLYNGANFTKMLDDVNVVNHDGLKLKKIQCMRQDKNGIIWLGSGLGEVEGLLRCEGKTITSYEPSVDRWIRGILEDSRGAIWLMTRSKGMWRFNGTGFERITKMDGRGTDLLENNQAMMEDRGGNMWFGGGEGESVESNGGIWRYDGKNFTNFTIKDGLGDYSVWSMLEDRAGNVWVGTRNTGLYKFDGTRFILYSE